MIAVILGGSRGRAFPGPGGGADSMHCGCKYKVKSYCQVGSLISSTVSVAFTR